MSPTVFRERGYRFYFFSREEPRMHVHVIEDRLSAYRAGEIEAVPANEIFAEFGRT